MTQQPTLTLDILYNATTVATKQQLEKFVKPLNDGFVRYQLNNPMRIAHFLAQICHESGEFRYQEEIASGEDYEGRTDLGNTQPGDGKRYKGRGLIQVTGRFNYGQFTKDCSYLGVDFVANPDKLAVIPYCVYSAFWYWDSRKLNPLADRDNLTGITRIINGGMNGYDDRLKYLGLAKKALRAAGYQV